MNHQAGTIAVRFVTTLCMLLLLSMVTPARAQCAMCKATAEKAYESGSKSVRNLNAGILYLLAFPYVAAGTLGFFWYRHQRKMNR